MLRDFTEVKRNEKRVSGYYNILAKRDDGEFKSVAYIDPENGIPIITEPLARFSDKVADVISQIRAEIMPEIEKKQEEKRKKEEAKARKRLEETGTEVLIGQEENGNNTETAETVSADTESGSEEPGNISDTETELSELQKEMDEVLSEALDMKPET